MTPKPFIWLQSRKLYQINGLIINCWNFRRRKDQTPRGDRPLSLRNRLTMKVSDRSGTAGRPEEDCAISYFLDAGLNIQPQSVSPSAQLRITGEYKCNNLTVTHWMASNFIPLYWSMGSTRQQALAVALTWRFGATGLSLATPIWLASYQTLHWRSCPLMTVLRVESRATTLTAVTAVTMTMSRTVILMTR